jgi:hypothetical protein
MSQLLLSHSPDLKQLMDEGYEVEIKGGYLLIHHIPYVNSDRKIKYGSLVSVLTLAGPTRTNRPADHTVYFIGDKPCHKEGNALVEIINSSQDQQLAEGIVTNHFFSSKPPEGYSNYYDKITTYVKILSAPAQAIDKSVTAQTFKLIPSDEEDVFQYVDSHSSRNNINQINLKFRGQKIAIIGLGGTGSYILDLVSKTPVQEIHLYDSDEFLQHNAFRSPGAVSGELLDDSRRMKKVDYFTSIYSKLHRGIIPHPEFITEENVGDLCQMSYVFICVDKDNARKGIIGSLLKMGIPFIDTGLGVITVDDKLIGIVRVTTGTPSKSDHLEKRIPADDDNENDYGTNIQIADLNALNAVFAIIKWKKLSGFYQDCNEEHHTTYTINTALLLNEETAA